MTFAAPWALVGLLAAAVPILLHLVQRREPPEQSFPAVQYLEDATREHRRRLQLRNWLLLLLRTMLVAALVFAAAGPIVRRAVPLGRHAPAAMALIVDNSASTAAVGDGAVVFESLRHAAGDVLARATPADRLWLLLADGVPRQGTAPELLVRLAAASPSAARLDLGAAVRQGRELVRSSGRSGEVVLVTDAQRSAVSPEEGEVPLLVLRPDGSAPPNRAITRLDPGPQPWGAEGGRIELGVSASDTAAVPVTLGFLGRPSRDLLVVPGLASSERVPAPPTGWRVARAILPPDELRLDDTRELALRVAPAATVAWDRADRFLDAALQVLVDAGRVSPGAGVRIGAPGAGAAIVIPPEDPALLGAVNRALAARGSSWRFGRVDGESSLSDSSDLLPDRIRVFRRVTLEAVGPLADTLVTVAGRPWIGRSGDLVLLGSRLEPEWTELPVRAAFVPLLDLLLTRTVRGEPVVPVTSVGVPVVLPGRVSTVSGPGGPLRVEGGAPWAPAAPGVYWLLEGADTVGAVTATIDPRESALARASADEMAAAWPGAIVAGIEGGAAASFTSGGRGDLRPLLLVLALGCVIGESLLAGRRIRSG